MSNAGIPLRVIQEISGPAYGMGFAIDNTIAHLAISDCLLTILASASVIVATSPRRHFL